MVKLQAGVGSSGTESLLLGELLVFIALLTLVYLVHHRVIVVYLEVGRACLYKLIGTLSASLVHFTLDRVMG